MAEIRYVPVHLKGLAPKAHLKDYVYNAADGTYAVASDENVGKTITKDQELHIIYPLQYPDDKNKKWVQAINQDGVAGFIRADHIDMKQIKEENARLMEQPYTYFSTRAEKVLYEASVGIKKYTKTGLKEYSQDDINQAKEELGQHKKKIMDGQKIIELYAMKKESPKFQIQDLLIDTDRKNSKAVGDLINDIVTTAGKGFPDAYLAVQTFCAEYKRISVIDDLAASGIKIKYDEKTGRIQTNEPPRDLIQYLGRGQAPVIAQKYGNGLFYKIQEDPMCSPAYEGLHLSTHDVNNFYAANRALAEKAATERAKYLQAMEKQESNATYEIPASLTSQVSRKEMAQHFADMKEKLKEKKEKAAQLSADAKKKPNFFDYQKEHHNGFLIGEDHTDPSAKMWLADQMDEMKSAGIKTIYIEHLFSGHEQRMIDEFFKSKSEELKPALVSLFSDQSMAGMETLLRAAKHNGIRIQGIGTELAQVDTNAATDPTAKFNRVLLFNQHAADQIRKDQNSLDEDKRGFVVLAGTAHHIMHQGKTLNTPIKGLSQLLEMPVFEFDKNKKDLGILSVAPDMIWDRDVQKAKHISDFCKEKGVKQSERWQRGIVRTSLEELGKEEAASRKPMIGSHRAPEQTREGKQWQSAVPKRNERSNITIGRKR